MGSLLTLRWGWGFSRSRPPSLPLSSASLYIPHTYKHPPRTASLVKSPINLPTRDFHVTCLPSCARGLPTVHCSSSRPSVKPTARQVVVRQTRIEGETLSRIKDRFSRESFHRRPFRLPSSPEGRSPDNNDSHRGADYDLTFRRGGTRRVRVEVRRRRDDDFGLRTTAGSEERGR